MFPVNERDPLVVLLEGLLHTAQKFLRTPDKEIKRLSSCFSGSSSCIEQNEKLLAIACLGGKLYR